MIRTTLSLAAVALFSASCATWSMRQKTATAMGDKILVKTSTTNFSQGFFGPDVGVDEEFHLCTETASAGTFDCDEVELNFPESNE